MDLQSGQYCFLWVCSNNSDQDKTKDPLYDYCDPLFPSLYCHDYIILLALTKGRDENCDILYTYIKHIDQIMNCGCHLNVHNHHNK